MRLHRAFKHLHSAAVAQVHHAVTDVRHMPEDTDSEIVVDRMVDLSVSLCEIYRLPSVDVRSSGLVGTGVSCFYSTFRADPEILINNNQFDASTDLINFLTSFRSHMVTQRPELSRFANGNTVAWAASILNAANPGYYRRMVRAGKVLGVTVRDTYSTESWAILTERELTNGDDLVVDSTLAWEILKEFEAEQATGDEDEYEDDPIEDEYEDDEYDDDEAYAAHLLTLGIGDLRKMSRGKFSGGYSLRKEALVSRLVQCR